MHFGIFIEEARPGLSQGDAFRESFETVDAAEALGLDCVWLGEIHFNPARSVISDPIAVARPSPPTHQAESACRHGVNVLPSTTRCASPEEAATVDHLSEGRFELGIGRSGAARTYDVLGIPYGESQARFREALEIIKEAWKGQAFSYEGQFYRFQNATVVPRPYQKPHPPIRMAANTPDTFRLVAELGLPIFVGLRDVDIPELQESLRSYRQAWAAAGHQARPSVYLRLPVYAGGPGRRSPGAAREHHAVLPPPRRAHAGHRGAGGSRPGGSARGQSRCPRTALVR
jgi:alkanesulfonate monooxygenase SsuD/methylene tetrahydromethanopterin reductase-like flavin-dependent oxidoreductase (luciferase family)